MLNTKLLKDMRQIHSSMGHMRPAQMVKAIEGGAVVVPSHITVEKAKQYAKLGEGCGPCSTSVLRKYPAYGDMAEKASEPGTWHMDLHELQVLDPQQNKAYLDIVDEPGSCS
jgi:hypothetical protein